MIEAIQVSRTGIVPEKKVMMWGIFGGATAAIKMVADASITINEAV